MSLINNNVGQGPLRGSFFGQILCNPSLNPLINVRYHIFKIDLCPVFLFFFTTSIIIQSHISLVRYFLKTPFSASYYQGNSELDVIASWHHFRKQYLDIFFVQIYTTLPIKKFRSPMLTNLFLVFPCPVSSFSFNKLHSNSNGFLIKLYIFGLFTKLWNNFLPQIVYSVVYDLFVPFENWWTMWILDAQSIFVA